MFALFSLPERFIQKVLHNVDRQHVNVDNLTPHNLDQLSRLIVDALQVVDKDQGHSRGPLAARPGPRDLGGRLTDEEEEEGADRENEEEERWKESTPTLKPGENLPVTPAEVQGHCGCIRFSARCVRPVQVGLRKALK